MAEAYVRQIKDSIKRKLFCDEVFVNVEPDPNRSTTPLSMPYIADPDSVVFYFAYFRETGGPYYCDCCFEAAVGINLTKENETLYIATGEKEALEFTIKDAEDPNNHCYSCRRPLYKFIKKCQQ